MFKHFSAPALAIALGLAVPAAMASSGVQEPIFRAPVGEADAAKSKTFAINPELGRAWVELSMHYAMSETSDYVRIAVPGLSYDRERSVVVFDAGDREVVCATVQESGWGVFRNQQIEPTGNCELSRRYVGVPVDNGFAVEQVEQLEVLFDVDA